MVIVAEVYERRQVAINGVMLQKKKRRSILKMKKQRIRINLDVMEELASRIRHAADRKDIAVNAFIRLALEDCLAKDEKDDK